MSTVTATPAPSSPSALAANEAEHWFARLGRFGVRRRRPLLVVWLLAVVVAAPFAITVSGALSGAGWEAQGSIAQRVRDELRQDFPGVMAEAAVVVVQQPTPIAEDDAAVRAVISGLTGADGVAAVADPLCRPTRA
jgi:RND superfamily putative drug exporter